MFDAKRCIEERVDLPQTGSPDYRAYVRKGDCLRSSKHIEDGSNAYH